MRINLRGEIMNWVQEKYRKPEFNKSVLCYCRIWGVFLGSYERLDPDYDWGNWRREDELGVLPPTHWCYIDIPNEFKG